MNIIIKQDVFFSFIWLFLGITVAGFSYNLKLGSFQDPGAGLFPFLLGVILSLCSVGILFYSLFFKGIQEKEAEGIWSNIEFKRLSLVIISLFGYILFLEKAGFALTTFIFLVILFKVVGSQKWVLVLPISFLAAIVSFLLFVSLLQIQFPAGILGDYLWKLFRI